MHINNTKTVILMDEDAEKKKSPKKALRIILLIIFLLIFICSSVYIGYYIYNSHLAGQEQTKITSTSAPASENYAENPIDFSQLQQDNDEIYAWIKVDGTNVDYPIVQSATDDNFYLKHSAIDKKWLASGAIYTEGCNRTDFSDPITVIYGHNGYQDTMFTTLHHFEEKDFFDSHGYFCIYMPNRKLTYQIVSAFKYDDRHIMNSFNFFNEADLNDFQQTVINPSSTVKNVRTALETEINKDSKIAVLSTCITGQKSNRYLVCGVLVKDEKTN